ncbi:MAG: CHAT domain-containing protein, partial [Cyanobacteriota bacterium ELA615]
KYPKQGYNIQALETSESARARSLLELLQEANANIKQGADPQLLNEEKKIIQQLDLLEKQRIETLGKNQALPASLTEKIDQLKQQYQEIQTQIRKSSPRYASLTQPQPLKLAQIQQLLDPNSVILEYALANEKSYLFMITKDNFSSYQIDGQEKIEKLVQQYHRVIKMKVSLKQVASPLRDILLAPVLPQIGNKRLIIVADGSLQTIPFSTINNINNEPLLQTNELINLPSASTLAILRDTKSPTKKPSKTLAIFADPVFTSDDPRLSKVSVVKINENELTRAAIENSINFLRLTNTKTEAENISKLVPNNQEKVFINFAANKANITNAELANYRILHLATHGVFNSQDPSRSGLVLSLYNQQGEPENGQLFLEDIFNLNLSNSELVVLSACDTGLGSLVKGEGIVGISRGFMYAGTPRLVVSLWSVDDLATSILMSKFYQGVLQEGLTPAKALRQAQMEMLKDPKYQAPYYWAPFILIGDWN